jgi:replication factor A1
MEYDVQGIFNALMEEGFNEGDIKEKIKEKVNEFSGFITNEGAAFLVAKDLGLNVSSPFIEGDPNAFLEQEIDYDEFTIPINELREGMSNIVILGVIYKIFQPKEFTRKDGTSGKVGSFYLSDPSGTVKIVVWDENVDLLSSKYFQKGEIVRFIGGYAKIGKNEEIEVHLGNKGKLEIAPEEVNKKLMKKLKEFRKSENPNAFEPIIKGTVKIKQLNSEEGFYHEITGTISKILNFKEFTKDEGTKSFLLKLCLEDETGSIPVVIWDMKAIEFLKLIEENVRVKITQFTVKYNDYAKQNEISFGKKSTLLVL